MVFAGLGRDNAPAPAVIAQDLPIGPAQAATGPIAAPAARRAEGLR
jgi:hypothetical protein